jgi:anaerobic magnesium-protoporphyrin IX monomethyl ester cyclase
MGRAMILFFNPLSTTPGKQPLPLSVLSLAAVVGDRRWSLVDGNVTPEPAAEIVRRLTAVPPGELALLAVTVMPGPQLSQAVPVCKAVRAALPHVPIVWGGYFPTQHAETVLRSAYVDFAVRSQGEGPLLQLIEALETGDSVDAVGSLSWKLPDGTVVHNTVAPSIPLDDLPDLPYEGVAMEDYIHPTCLGRRTVAHNSSFGCPFACSFCAVVAMSNRRWLAQAPPRVERVLARLTRDYQVDAVQMHDMDFFISEARVAEIAERITPLGLSWWGLGRIDTLMQYSDDTFRKMARSGLRMVFSGAESASDATLKTMNKGGKAAAHLAIELAARMRHYGIVPEYSFVLGSPPDPLTDMAQTFEFIRRIKGVNPDTEVVLYTYTPVPLDGAMYTEASRLGFAFPETLDEWASDRWRQAMMRRGEHIPWMDGGVRTRVRNFERVLNAYYPTATDRRLTPGRRKVLRAISSWRYALRMYAAPYELRAIQRVIRYQRPETTGF